MCYACNRGLTLGKLRLLRPHALQGRRLTSLRRLLLRLLRAVRARLVRRRSRLLRRSSAVRLVGRSGRAQLLAFRPLAAAQVLQANRCLAGKS